MLASQSRLSAAQRDVWPASLHKKRGKLSHGLTDQDKGDGEDFMVQTFYDLFMVELVGVIFG